MSHANSQYWAGSLMEASKGLWPRQYEVPGGTVLYRFIDLTQAPSIRAADGPWWFEFEHFQTIKHFAERNGYTLGYAARLFAAILYEWSGVNAFVRARAKTALLAWKGRGKQVVAKGEDARDVAVVHGILTSSSPAVETRMTPMQGDLEVYQLYIPGLGKPHRKFATLFDFMDSQQIRS